MSVFDDLKGVLPARRILERYLGPSRGSWRCPFHKDRTPSLSARGEGIVCFGCDWKGDAIAFIRDYCQVTPGEALKIAANIAGVILPERSPQPSHRLPSLHNSIEQIRRETRIIEKDILKQASRAAAQAWRQAWKEQHTEQVWDAVAVGAALDREIALLEMQIPCEKTV